MKIIDFIKSHKNWKELLSNPPYSLNIKEKNNLILFNYSQINTDASYDLTLEARGLILEKNSWNIICYGFNRFFNIGEKNAASIDWDNAIATSKEDGTLFFLYYYDDEWHIKTRSTFDAYEAPLDNGGFKNYEELFKYLVQFYPDFKFSNLNKSYTYCLEGCSRINKVVLDYSVPKLYHILTRNNDTLEEIETNIGIPKPAEYALGDKEDYENFVAAMGEDHEGIVVRDKDNNRVKIKTQSYFALHRLVNNHIITLSSALELILKNETAELLAYFPEFKPYFDEVQLQLDGVRNKIKEIEEEVKEEKKTKNKKEFVEWVGNREYRPVYIAAYDNKLWQWFGYNENDTDEALQRKIRNLIKFFKLDS